MPGNVIIEGTLKCKNDVTFDKKLNVKGTQANQESVEFFKRPYFKEGLEVTTGKSIHVDNIYPSEPNWGSKMVNIHRQAFGHNGVWWEGRLDRRIIDLNDDIKIAK